MEVTALDIIDSAVKIGLGALITFVMTYLITRLKYRSDLDKELRARRQALLEQVANQVEELNTTYLDYHAYMLDLVRTKKEGNEWSRYKKEKFDKITDELSSGFHELTSAESKLLLLGEMDTHNALRSYGEKLFYFTQNVYGDREGLKEEDITSLTSEITKARIKFYKLLSKRFTATNVSN